MSNRETSERKSDHIDLAFESQISDKLVDHRFYYEPLLNAHPSGANQPHNFLGQKFGFPVWVSSMTGGTKKAKIINENLAKVCGEYKLGMGLGSCRIILDDNEHLADFSFRHLINDQPYYANLGIAQVEALVENNQLNKAIELVKKLEADGLIIHINPLQEWLQPEGDRIKVSPIETIKVVLQEVDFPLIIKEVGQGMGPESLKALMKLPVKAIEFGAHGGTNFSKLELLRAKEKEQINYSNLALIGHTAEDMVGFVNQIVADNKSEIQCSEVIISGGVKNFLDGYYLVNKIHCQAVYGQASAFLKHAAASYDQLCEYVESQRDGYLLANQFLTIR